MSKKYIWVLLAVLLCAGILWGYRYFTAVSYLSMLPSHPKVLAFVDWQRLSDENNMKEDDWQGLLPEGVDLMDTGIDWSEKSYAFISADEHVGLLVPVRDYNDLLAMFEGADAKGICSGIEEYRGCSWTVYDGAWMIGFNSRALLVMGPGLGTDMDVLRREMMLCFKQDKDKSGMASPLYADLKGKDASLRMASELGVLPVVLGGEFLEDFSEQVVLRDGRICADVCFSSHGVAIETEFVSDNPELDKYFDRLTRIGGHLEGDFTGNVPSDALAWACINVDGSVLLDELRKNPVVRTLLLGLNMNVDADLIIKSIKGDVAVTVNAGAFQENTDVLLTARLADSEFLREADYWKESAAVRNGYLSFKDYGNNRFGVNVDGVQIYFGVQGKTLYVTPEMRLTEHVDGGNGRTLSAWNDRIVKSRLFLWMNLKKLLHQPETGAILRSSGAGEIGDDKLELFDAAVLHTADARRFTIELYTHEERNVLKDLLD